MVSSKRSTVVPPRRCGRLIHPVVFVVHLACGMIQSHCLLLFAERLTPKEFQKGAPTVGSNSSFTAMLSACVYVCMKFEFLREFPCTTVALFILLVIAVRTFGP